MLTFEAGKLKAIIANGEVEVFTENADTLDGISQIRPNQINEVPNAEFNAILIGRIPESQ